MISAMFLLNEEGKLSPSRLKTYQSKVMGGKDGCKERLEAATISDILHSFGQGKFTFIREK